MFAPGQTDPSTKRSTAQLAVAPPANDRVANPTVEVRTEIEICICGSRSNLLSDHDLLIILSDKGSESCSPTAPVTSLDNTGDTALTDLPYTDAHTASADCIPADVDAGLHSTGLNAALGGSGL